MSPMGYSHIIANMQSCTQQYFNHHPFIDQSYDVGGYTYSSLMREHGVVKIKETVVKYRFDILAFVGAVLGTFVLKFLWNYFFPTFKMDFYQAGFICFITALLIRSPA